ncbi:MAG: hypothetical protein ACRDZN_00360, partial [Acidimicrobiales bacterium]
PREAADAAGTTTGSGPSDDLLAALSRHTTLRSGVGPVRPVPPTSPGGGNGRHAYRGPATLPLAAPQVPPGATSALSAPAAPPLTRRVRGAQLPNTAPLSLRRTTGEHRIPPPPPARPPEQQRTADDVYSFLTSFTAGEQRGLDDARPPGTRDMERR